MDKQLTALRDEYIRAIHAPTKPEGLQKLPKNHIQDENKSVRWNREFVEQANLRYSKTLSEFQRQRDEAINAVKKKIYLYIQNDLGISENGAAAIFRYAQALRHNDGQNAVFDALVDIMDVVWECVKKK